jgi:hypothetical protein
MTRSKHALKLLEMTVGDLSPLAFAPTLLSTDSCAFPLDRDSGHASSLPQPVRRLPTYPTQFNDLWLLH